MGKRYRINYELEAIGGNYYVEVQEGDAWVIVAGPFATEDQAWDALDKLRED